MKREIYESVFDFRHKKGRKKLIDVRTNRIKNDKTKRYIFI